MTLTYREIHIPSMLIAAILGYQIAIYFFHQYHKNKSDDLQLNKILLAFGCFFSFLLSGFIIRIISNYYLVDPAFYELFSLLTTLVVLLSVISFLVIVAGSAFKEIINVKYTKIIIGLNIIPIISIFIFPSDSPEYQLFLIPNSLGLIFMLIFELKLLRKTSGDIKRRLIFIILGEVMLGVSLVFGREQNDFLLPSSADVEIVWIISIYVAIAGLGIIFLGVYQFPAFLEFDWQKTLLKLTIIDQKDRNIIFTFDFTDTSSGEFQNREIKPDLTSGGIKGIDDILQTYNRSQNNVRVDKIKHGNVIIFLQHGEDQFNDLTYVLIVNKDLKSCKYFLSSIKEQFEGLFKGILQNLNNINTQQMKIFDSFETIVNTIAK